MSFVDSFIGAAPPAKKRSKTALLQKSPRDQLVKDVKQLLRRAIATRIRISKVDFDTYLDVEELVENYLRTAIAISSRTELNEAIEDIQKLRGIIGGEKSRKAVLKEVEYCYG